jgi:hypothetical protein
MKIPWVLATTKCAIFPSTKNVQNAIAAANIPDLGFLKLFLANDESLYLHDLMLRQETVMDMESAASCGP